jgi:hypothetical protein
VSLRHLCIKPPAAAWLGITFLGPHRISKSRIGLRNVAFLAIGGVAHRVCNCPVMAQRAPNASPLPWRDADRFVQTNINGAWDMFRPGNRPTLLPDSPDAIRIETWWSWDDWFVGGYFSMGMLHPSWCVDWAVAALNCANETQRYRQLWGTVPSFSQIEIRQFTTSEKHWSVLRGNDVKCPIQHRKVRWNQHALSRDFTVVRRETINLPMLPYVSIQHSHLEKGNEFM